MPDSYPRMLELWEGQGFPALSAGDSAPLGASSAEKVARLYSQETFQKYPGPREGTEPYSLQWLLDVETRRYGRYGCWIPRLLEFTKHAGEKVLCLGGGLGTDWTQYARNGASVVVASPSEEHLRLVRHGFTARGLSAQLVHAPPESLPLEPSSIDVACLHLLDEQVDMGQLADEVYRLLKPGGKILALVRSRYDVDFWCGWLPWRVWLKHTSLLPRSGRLRYSARDLRRTFQRFSEQRIHKRHLRRAEIPHVWRWLPLPLLERAFGRVLLLKAFKPLSAAITIPLAA